MKTYLISGSVVVIAIIVFICLTRQKKPIMTQAERITIDGLKGALLNLQNGQTESDFIGITSNGIDCIYFMCENGKFNIDFEAMNEDQLPYIEKLKEFSNKNHITHSMATYNNKPLYQTDKFAPVIHLATKQDIDGIVALVEKIQSEIFGNNKETIYDVVP